MEVDIHKYNEKMEHSLRKIKEADISKENKEALMSFYRYCVATGISNGKLHRYLDDLRRNTQGIKKDYKDYTREDIEKIVIRLEKTDFTEWTKYSYKIGLRKFFTWLRGTGEVPPEVKWLKLNPKNLNNKLPEELLTEEEVKKLISCSNKTRNRALIACLYESGCRIYEILTIRMKHVSFDNYGAVINVFGKTGSRRVRLVSSIAYLQEWINQHPANNDPNSFVWVQECNPKKILGYDIVRKILQRTAEKAGVKKKVNPHSFRHARASFLANHLTESQLKEVFGWAQASKMASVYVHLSGRNTDSAILKVYGKKIEEEVKGGVLIPVGCPRCKTENESTNRFCKLCGMPLDADAQKEIITREVTQGEASKLMDSILQDKEMVTMFMKRLQTLKAS